MTGTMARQGSIPLIAPDREIVAWNAHGLQKSQYRGRRVSQLSSATSMHLAGGFSVFCCLPKGCSVALGVVFKEHIPVPMGPTLPPLA